MRFGAAEGAVAVLRGFTLSGGDGDLEETSESTACTSVDTCTDYFSTWCGGGLYIEGADPTIEDVIIQANSLPETAYLAKGNDEYFTYSYGGGACFIDSNAALDGVLIADNFADQGGAVYVDESSTVVFEHVRLFGNTATDGGAVLIDGGAVVMTNVLAAWNQATEDGGTVLLLDGVASVTNASFARGSAPTGAGLYMSGTSTLRLVNSIVTDHSSEGLLADSTGFLVARYNDVFGNVTNYSGLPDPTGTDGNISVNPRFLAVTNNADWTDDDFRLEAKSPCVDAGYPDKVYLDVDGSANDMGAYGGPGGSW